MIATVTAYPLPEDECNQAWPHLVSDVTEQDVLLPGPLHLAWKNKIIRRSRPIPFLFSGWMADSTFNSVLGSNDTSQLFAAIEVEDNNALSSE